MTEAPLPLPPGKHHIIPCVLIREQAVNGILDAIGRIQNPRLAALTPNFLIVVSGGGQGCAFERDEIPGMVDKFKARGAVLNEVKVSVAEFVAIAKHRIQCFS